MQLAGFMRLVEKTCSSPSLFGSRQVPGIGQDPRLMCVVQQVGNTVLRCAVPPRHTKFNFHTKYVLKSIRSRNFYFSGC